MFAISPKGQPFGDCEIFSTEEEAYDQAYSWSAELHGTTVLLFEWSDQAYSWMARSAVTA